MKYFININTLEELKKEYKKLAMEHHPDRGGDLTTMQNINAEYDKMFTMLKDSKTTETSTDYKTIIEELLKFEGITIEILGSWIWLTGETFPIKESLKTLGFKWSKARSKWYLGELTGNKHYKKKSFEELKNTYSYKEIKTNKAPFKPQLT